MFRRKMREFNVRPRTIAALFGGNNARVPEQTQGQAKEAKEFNTMLSECKVLIAPCC